jgi:hypothetical protein
MLPVRFITPNLADRSMQEQLPTDAGIEETD